MSASGPPRPSVPLGRNRPTGHVREVHSCRLVQGARVDMPRAGLHAPCLPVSAVTLQSSCTASLPLTHRTPRW